MSTPAAMTPTKPAPPVADSPRKLLAHPLHTIVLLLAILSFSFLGAGPKAAASRVARGRVAVLSYTIAYQWAFVGYIYLGIRRRGVTLRQVIGGRWDSAEAVLLDAGLAIVLWLIAIVAVVLTKAALGMVHMDPAANMAEARETARALDFLIPRSNLELGLYALLAATAGFCEELLFRGYLQQQLSALSGSAAVGIGAQALIFGTAHGYQGWKLMIVLSSFGACFGIFAHYRKSLRPGMMTHAWQDLFTGLAMKFLSKAL
jgi:CAAX protease family protein